MQHNKEDISYKFRFTKVISYVTHGFWLLHKDDLADCYQKVCHTFAA